jgi:hypothetical protein
MKNTIYKGKHYFEITKESEHFYGIYHCGVLFTSSTTKNGAFSKLKLIEKAYQLGYETSEDFWNPS